MSKIKNKFDSSIITKLLASVAGVGYASTVLALPTGGAVPAGGGTATIPAPAGSTLTVTQTTPKAIINWSTFNVSASELVKFVQPDASSVVLNRDLSGSLSQISGALEANGNVFLINPAGVMFGAGSSVNVNGLLATTLDVTDAAFMGSSPLSFTGNASGSIVNKGTISAGSNAQSGYVYLIAPVVDNQGVIKGHAATSVGTVTMAAGNQFNVTLGSGLINFAVSQDALTTAVSAANKVGVSNSGTLTADQVILNANQNSALMSSVVNNSGVIEATNLVEIKSGKIQQNGSIAKKVTTQTLIIPPVTITTATPTTTISMEATDEITTSNTSITRAETLNLEVTKEGASLGTQTTSLRVDADILNATTDHGNVYIKDTGDDLMIGSIDTGVVDRSSPDAILTSVKLAADDGSILQGVGSGIRAGSSNLSAKSAIGESGDAIKTESIILIGAAKDGGIYVENTGDLILGSVVAQQVVTTTTTIDGTDYNNSSPYSLIDDGSGKLTLPNNTAGTSNVVITTSGVDESNKGNIVLTGTVSATNKVEVASAGGIYYTTSDDPSTPAPAPLITAKALEFEASGDIGQAGAALKLQTETVDMSTTDGGVFINETNGLSALKIEAAKDVEVTLENGDVLIDSVLTNSSGTDVNIIAKKGNILAMPGTSINIRGSDVNLLASKFIGDSTLLFGPIKLEANTATAETQSNKAIYLTNTDLLDGLKVTTKNGVADVKMNGGSSSLVFNPTNGNLSVANASGMGLDFTNSAGNVVLNGIALGNADDLAITASGAITQSGVNPAIAKAIKLTAGTGIGSSGSHLKTQTGDMNLFTSTGGVFADNTTAPLLLLTAATGNGNVSITQAGDLTLRSASASGSGAGNVLVDATGAIKGVGSASHVVASGGATLKGSSVGESAAPIRSAVSGGMSADASNGGIWINNTGTLSNFSADTGGTGDITFKNTGDVAFGEVLAPGKNILINITGKGTDANDTSDNGTINFEASGFDFTGASFGAVGNRIEINVDRLVINTKSGGIYAYQKTDGGPPKKLSLQLAQSTGTGADIQIESDGDMDLGVVQAAGNTVKLVSGGVIKDTRPDNEARPNVKGKSLDISAGGGIQGKNGGNLALDVSFLSASGGDGEVAAENQSAVALDAATLTAKAGSAITIIAPDITILDDQGGTITINGGSLTLTATKGNIVFLDGKDTIQLTGGGSIKLSANAAPPDVGVGYSGVIVAGNLTTDGAGDINLSAESNITIGMLDASGTGNVTVASNHGIIIDGNGTAQNIRGNVVTLLASTPSQDDAEINRTTAAAEFSAQTVGLAIRKSDLERDQARLDSDTNLKGLTETIRDDLDSKTNQLESQVETLSDAVDTAQAALDAAGLALSSAAVARNAGAVIAGAAQAVPFSGDAGADAVFAVIDLALSAAQLTVDGLQFALDKKAGELDEKLLELNSSSDRLFSTNANLAILTAQVEQEEAQVAIDEENVFRATFMTAASARVRDQATTAFTLNKDIDSSSSKPLGITAKRLDINDGSTVNTSLYLDSSGDLGLGNISLAPGHDLVVGVPVGSSPTVGVVQGDIGIVGNVKTSNKLDALGNVVDRGTMILQAKKAIVDNGSGADGKVFTSDLIMIAGTGVGTGADAIDIQVENIAIDGGAGGVKVENQSEAALNVTTLGSVTGVSGDGDITIKTDADLNLKQLVKDQNLATNHTITLISTGGSIVDKNLTGVNTQANTVVASAKNDIELDTDANILDAATSASGTGNILVRELSDIRIRDVSAGNGNVDISGVNLSVANLAAAATDITKGNVKLTATGRVDDDGVNTTYTSARIFEIKAAGAVGDTTVSSDQTLRSLDTKVDTLIVDAAGVVNVAENDDVLVKSVKTTGDVTLQSATGTLKIAEVTTATTGTTVTLFATQGAITDNLVRDPDAESVAPNVTAAKLAMKAGTGLGTSSDALDLKVAEVEGETATGGINLVDLDGDLKIADVTPGLNLSAINGLNVTTSGAIKVDVLQGSLTQDRQVKNTSGDITLKAKTNINANSLIDTDSGKISITATDGEIIAASTAPISGTDDVTLTAKTNISTASTIDTLAGNVALTAQTGSITQGGAISSSSSADRDSVTGVFPSGNITLSAATNVLQNANITAVNGDVSLKATGATDPDTQAYLSGDITMASGTSTLVSSEGDINYDAGRDLNTETLDTAKGDVDLTAGKKVVAGKAITTDDGAVKITATRGSITTDTDAPISASKDVTLTAKADITTGDAISTEAGNIALTAQTGSITQNDVISTNSTADRDSVTGAFPSGNITLSAATNVLQNANITAVNGDVSLKATGATDPDTQAYLSGDITMASGASTLVSSEGDINYDAGRDLNTETLDTAKGDVALTAGNKVVAGKAISTDDGAVRVTATHGSITTDTDAPISASKDVTLTAKTDITTGDSIETLQGNVALTAQAGSITQNDVISTNSTADRDSVTGAFPSGNITLSAATNVAQNADISANNGDVSLIATGTVDPDTEAYLSGDITMAAVTSTSITGAGNISYKAGRNLLIDTLETPDAVSLAATNGAITVQPLAVLNVKAKDLTATSATGIGTSTDVLKTEIETLSATVTSTGDIHVNEKDAVDLAKVKTNNGSATIIADGDIKAGDVDLNGNATLTSTDGSLSMLQDGKIKAGVLTVSAAYGVDVDTKVTSADVTVTDSGDLTIDEDDAIALTNLDTNDGDITVKAGGKISIDTVSSSDNVKLESTGADIVLDRADLTPAQAIDGKELTLVAATGIGESTSSLTTNVDKINATTTSGGIYIDQAKAVTLDKLTSTSGAIKVAVADGDVTVATVTTTGDVTLTADNGSLLDDADGTTVIAGDKLTLTSTQGIGAGSSPFQTKGASIVATVTDAGDIQLEEQDGLNKLDASTVDGDIKVRSLAGNMGIGLVQATDKSVTLTADAGSIFDADNEVNDGGNALTNIIGNRLDVNAKTGIGLPGNYLDVEIDTLAAATDTGGIYIYRRKDAPLTLETNPAGGNALQANGGDIAIKSDGEVVIADNLSNSGGGDISIAAAGDIYQNADIAVEGKGGAALGSGGKIDMALDASTNAESGTVAYKAQDSVSISTITTNTGLGGGIVSLNAPQLIDNLPGVANVTTWVLDMVGENADKPMVRQLLGDAAAESALLRLNYRIIGGTLADSRTFMGELLQPLQFAGNTPANGALMGSMNPVSSVQLDAQEGFTKNAEGEWEFRP